MHHEVDLLVLPGHAIQHYRHADHCYSLELETQQIWDYVGDKSVHQLNQSKVGSKSTVTHHQCVSSEGECGDKEDEEFGGVLFSSKVDTFTDVFSSRCHAKYLLL
ncbi:BRCA1-associated protein [Tanacetum coccineum]|uniref:BRCA1-associated protein n=1 Tax=Tanacetum coccineum TaxID=301880 RepID=A0ABQ4WBV3_9ASTR